MVMGGTAPEHGQRGASTWPQNYRTRSNATSLIRISRNRLTSFRHRAVKPNRLHLILKKMRTGKSGFHIFRLFRASWSDGPECRTAPPGCEIAPRIVRKDWPWVLLYPAKVSQLSKILVIAVRPSFRPAGVKMAFLVVPRSSGSWAPEIEGVVHLGGGQIVRVPSSD